MIDDDKKQEKVEQDPVELDETEIEGVAGGVKKIYGGPGGTGTQFE